MARGPLTNKTGLEQLENRAKVMELRKQGMSFDDIATHLGISWTLTQKYFHEAFMDLKEKTRENAADWRAWQTEKYVEIYTHMQPLMERGSASATAQCMNAVAAIGKLYGTDAPIKVAPTNIAGDQSYDSIDTGTAKAIVAHLISRSQAGTGGSSGGDPSET